MAATPAEVDAGPLAFDSHALIVMGLISAAACYSDVPATGGTDDDKRKREAVHAGLRRLTDLAAATDAAPDLAPLTSAQGVNSRHRELQLALSLLDGDRAAQAAERIALELMTASPWPGDLKWSGDKASLIAVPLQVVEPALTSDKLVALEKAYKKASARLARSSVSRTTKVLLAAGSLGVTAASAGLAAPAIGAAIGGAMGLSGAAATSAGLAFLGGGSLAAGGFGMAGGVLLVKVAAGVAYKGSKYVATSIAAASRAGFIHEMAKLHVSARLVERRDPSVRGQVIKHLERLEADLASALRAAERDQRDAQLKHDRLPSKARHGDIARLGKEQGRLRAAVRVVTAERKELSRPSWQKVGAAGACGLAALRPKDLLDALS